MKTAEDLKHSEMFEKVNWVTIKFVSNFKVCFEYI